MANETNDEQQHGGAAAAVESERQVKRPAKRSQTSSVCRFCGCTDFDCRKCVELTGRPCSWVEPNVCSVCEPIAKLERAIQSARAYSQVEWQRRMLRLLKLIRVPAAASSPAAVPAGGS